MNLRIVFTLSAIVTISLCNLKIFAHPTGNMIVVNDRVYWSYIYPVESVEHRACVMTWSDGEKPEVILQSQYPASDFMLYNQETQIYIIERRYLQNEDVFKSRILKMEPGEKPAVIWDWFTDLWRVGEGGFFMLSEDQIVFARYPEIYSFKKEEKPIKHFEFDSDIKRIRAVENNQILLLGDSACYLVKYDGTISDQWDRIITKSIQDSPLNRNQVFDVDYKNGRLLTAYWGKRSFEIFDASGNQEVVLQQAEPLTPHWVAIGENRMWLFSSEIFFDQRTPRPHLILVEGENRIKVIWSVP